MDNTTLEKMREVLKAEDCTGISIVTLEKSVDGFNFSVEGDPQIVKFLNSLIDDRKELTKLGQKNRR